METSLYGGWPLTNSSTFPGEKSLTCPRCGSQKITFSTRFGRGTGPQGRPRMGDPGNRDYVRCNNCQNTADLMTPEEKRYVVYSRVRELLAALVHQAVSQDWMEAEVTPEEKILQILQKSAEESARLHREAGWKGDGRTYRLDVYYGDRERAEEQLGRSLTRLEFHLLEMTIQGQLSKFTP